MAKAKNNMLLVAVVAAVGIGVGAYMYRKSSTPATQPATNPGTNTGTGTTPPPINGGGISPNPPFANPITNRPPVAPIPGGTVSPRTPPPTPAGGGTLPTSSTTSSTAPRTGGATVDANAPCSSGGNDYATLYRIGDMVRSQKGWVGTNPDALKANLQALSNTIAQYSFEACLTLGTYGEGDNRLSNSCRQAAQQTMQAANSLRQEFGAELPCPDPMYANQWLNSALYQNNPAARQCIDSILGRCRSTTSSTTSSTTTAKVTTGVAELRDRLNAIGDARVLL